MANVSTGNKIPDEIARHIKIPSLSRQFHGDYSLNNNTLHVLQWNVLAQALSYTKNNFVRVPDDVVAFENRKWRILEQIIARRPDLCALEEMDIFNDFLKDELPKYGYSCHFVEKINSKCFLFQNDTENFKGPDGFTPKAILQFPTKDEIGPNALPSINYPSDHLALEVIFNIQ
ncbi:unnamed protein product [Rotaria sordida]|uniref:Nocturnin n=1 Tax=Rotaria sordida TaxID=392033 RepID=A0A815LZR9_9BILA|nr:unnamed protein product [Rotaria sordida]